MTHSTRSTHRRVRRYTLHEYYPAQPRTGEEPGLRQDVFWSLQQRWAVHAGNRYTAWATARHAEADAKTPAESNRRRAATEKANVRKEAAHAVLYHLNHAYEENFDGNGSKGKMTLQKLAVLREDAVEEEQRNQRYLAEALKENDKANVAWWREYVRQFHHLVLDIEEMLARWRTKAWRAEAPKRRYYNPSGRLIHPPIGKRKRTAAKRRGDPSFDGSFLS